MNTVKRGKISIVVVGNKGKYLGICREFGFIQEGTSPLEVQKRLMSSCLLLLNTVKKNPRLEPSLNVSPPFKYLMIYYWVVCFTFIARMVYDFVSFTTENRTTPAYA